MKVGELLVERELVNCLLNESGRVYSIHVSSLTLAMQPITCFQTTPSRFQQTEAMLHETIRYTLLNHHLPIAPHVRRSRHESHSLLHSRRHSRRHSSWRRGLRRRVRPAQHRVHRRHLSLQLLLQSLRRRRHRRVPTLHLPHKNYPPTTGVFTRAVLCARFIDL